MRHATHPHCAEPFSTPIYKLHNSSINIFKNLGIEVFASNQKSTFLPIFVFHNREF
jgi:hypothetical protein